MQATLLAKDVTHADSAQSLPSRVRAVITSIKELILSEPTSAIFPFSAGKDSSVVASLGLAALRELKEEGQLSSEIEHMVISANTLIENPLVARLMREQQKAMVAYKNAYDIPLRTNIVIPSLSESFQVSVLGGRRMMPGFGMSSGCSKDWKVSTCQKAVRDHQKALPKGTRTITFLGSRTDEGTKRSNNLDKQGAKTGVEVSFHDGQWLAYPIIDFTTEDVFNYLLMASNAGGPFPTYRDNQGDVLRLYSNAGGGACALLVNDSAAGSLQTCSARTGCFACQVNGDEDQSLQSLVDMEAPHLQPLVDFRQFLKQLGVNPAYRNFLGTLPNKDGKVSMGAKGYAGWVLLDMVRFLLSADASEAERAYREGCSPDFQVLDIRQIMAIDYNWSVRGLQRRPFEALRAWVEVHEQGKRYALPALDAEVIALPRSEPKEVPGAEMAAMNSLSTIVDQMMSITRASSSSLDVDLEGAIAIVEFEADRLLCQEGGIETAAQTLTRLGVVSVCTGRLKETDVRLSTVTQLDTADWLQYGYQGGLPPEVGGLAQQSLF